MTTTAPDLQTWECSLCHGRDDNCPHCGGAIAHMDIVNQRVIAEKEKAKTTEQDRAAFEKMAAERGFRTQEKWSPGEYKDRETMRNAKTWQAALAYARAEQAEREKRLIKYMSSETDREWLGLSLDDILANFNAQEQGR